MINLHIQNTKNITFSQFLLEKMKRLCMCDKINDNVKTVHPWHVCVSNDRWVYNLRYVKCIPIFLLRERDAYFFIKHFIIFKKILWIYILKNIFFFPKTFSSWHLYIARRATRFSFNVYYSVCSIRKWDNIHGK